MKVVISFLIVFLFFFVGCTEDCDSDGYNSVRIISTVKLDSIASDMLFREGCWAEGPICHEAPIDIKSTDSIHITVFSSEDSLFYKIKHRTMQNTYIIIDTIPAPSCKLVHGLAEHRGYGHYRVESKRLYSCVFFVTPTCD